MSNETIYTCDKCGAKGGYSQLVHVTVDDARAGAKHKDFCHQCWKLLEK